jgi:hypothetical protein
MATKNLPGIKNIDFISMNDLTLYPKKYISPGQTVMAIAKLNELGLVENGSCQYISEKMDGGLVYNTKINAVIYDDDITTPEVQNRLITGKYAYMLTDVYGCQYLIGIDSAPYPEIVFNNLNDSDPTGIRGANVEITWKNRLPPIKLLS